jgi:hypothetical protein
MSRKNMPSPLFYKFLKLLIMNTLELKGNLLEIIADVRDEAILKKLQAAFRKITQPEKDWWDDLTAEEQASLEATLAECDDPNNMVSDEDAQKQINEFSFSKEQNEQLKLAIAESRMPENRIPYEDIKNEFAQWFKK